MTTLRKKQKEMSHMQMKLSKLVNKVEGFDANHDLLLLMENLRVKLHYANYSLAQQGEKVLSTGIEAAIQQQK